ncbi:MAG: hypothetical protein QOJ45_1452 [Verrucomicrobiota bacterium]|jgi:hypothetical protein
MRWFPSAKSILLFLPVFLLFRGVVFAADHNDPNAINSLFTGIEASPADLYDLYGFPSDNTAGGEKVVIALTFASAPATGVFDPDLLYRILISPNPRIAPPLKSDASLEGVLGYFKAIREKYLGLKPSEVRVTVGQDSQAKVEFLRFPSGNFTKVIAINKSETVEAGGSSIKVFVGGRDDAFFNDLPGFFRSINYAPQFYNVPLSMENARELPIPKTLIELEGNDLFNFDPSNPELGYSVKKDLPPGPWTWKGNKYKKDDKGNYRFVYSGKDYRAGYNINAIIVEIPLAFLTKTPEVDRIVNAWGESWVRKTSGKIPTIPDDRTYDSGIFGKHPWCLTGLILALGLLFFILGIRAGTKRRSPEQKKNMRWWARPKPLIVLGILFLAAGAATGVVARLRAQQLADLVPAAFDEELKSYKIVDTDGQPFADAALNEREDKKQVGANNFWLGPSLVTRLAHLGWGFGPSITALGLRTSFDHDNSPISVHKTYDAAHILDAFRRAKKTLFQELNMPDDSWNKKHLNIPLKRSFEIFVPNVCPIDMDTTGTWPYGRRLEDQVATRFLSLFLDMSPDAKGRKYHIETLSDQALWDAAPIEPKTPPNPLKNDKPFLDRFPYLADPW